MLTVDTKYKTDNSEVKALAKQPDEIVEKAKSLYLEGHKLIEISKLLDIPEGTIRSWKNRQKWDSTVATEKKSVATKRGAPMGNKNGKGGPVGNKKAEKYGFLSKYLPGETLEIFNSIENASPLDLLWHTIKMQYTAFIRAQSLMYVKDQQDSTTTRIEEKNGNVWGEKWEVQQAWDKHANFMKAQSTALSALTSSINRYEDMLNRLPMATEEQRLRIELLKVDIDNKRGNEEELSKLDKMLEAMTDEAKR